MTYDIPPGYSKVRTGNVEPGDKIKAESEWVPAENISRRSFDPKSVIGHPVCLYECVIRKVSSPAATDKA